MIGPLYADDLQKSSTEIYMSNIDNVYKSTDNGQTWVDLNENTPTTIVNIVAKNTGNLIGSSNFDILESADNGVTWTSKTTVGLPSLAGNLITSFRVLHDETIYITIDNNMGVFYSTDWGVNWTNITSNINSSQIIGNSIAVSTGGYLFASPSNSGIYRSVNPVTTSTIGIEAIDEANNHFQVYPNPGSTVVFLEYPSEAGVTLEIFTEFGQVMYKDYFEFKTGLESIDISSLSSGIYFVRLTSETNSALKKLIIE
jgi:hypothetical protein